VPQGSVLGPSLFLYYINDIPIGLDSTIRLFADDTIAYLVIKSNSDNLTLHRDLDKLAQWEQLWKMVFHPDKCNGRNKTPVKFKYCLHGHVLESVDMAKYLGVTISEDLKWESHINNICGKLKPIRLLASCVAT
jgi:adenine C2-methylase RlmN of 23S rRNA A2503 and tRNA A37